MPSYPPSRMFAFPAPSCAAVCRVMVSAPAGTWTTCIASINARRSCFSRRSDSSRREPRFARLISSAAPGCCLKRGPKRACSSAASTWRLPNRHVGAWTRLAEKREQPCSGYCVVFILRDGPHVAKSESPLFRPHQRPSSRSCAPCTVSAVRL